MLRLLSIFILCSLSTSFITHEDQGAASSPSPHGDTRMGADATGLGKDLSEDAVQSQEDSIMDLIEQNELGKENPTKKDKDHMDVQ
jgi:hypothetical protein